MMSVFVLVHHGRKIKNNKQLLCIQMTTLCVQLNEQRCMHEIAESCKVISGNVEGN